MASWDHYLLETPDLEIAVTVDNRLPGLSLYIAGKAVHLHRKPDGFEANMASTNYVLTLDNAEHIGRRILELVESERAKFKASLVQT